MRHPDDSKARPQAGEEEVRRLLEGAGRRPSIPREDLEAISAVARATWQEQRRRRSRTRTTALALAALLVLTVGLVLWRTAGPADPPPTVARTQTATGLLEIYRGADLRTRLSPGEPIPAGAVLRTGSDGERPGRVSLRLVSGSQIRLDDATEVRLLSPASLELRAGALYADTGAMEPSETALQVKTPLGVVRDLGTRFAVRLSATTPPALLLRVRAGEVAVSSDGARHVATTGEELLLAQDGSVVRRPVPPHGPIWAWVMDAAPAFDLAGRRLGEILDWMAAETGWEVRFADAAAEAAARQAVVEINAEVRPQQVPSLVLPTAHLQGRLEDGVLTIRRLPPPVTAPR